MLNYYFTDEELRKITNKRKKMEEKSSYENLRNQLSEILIKSLKENYCKEKHQKIPESDAVLPKDSENHEKIVQFSKMLRKINEFYEYFDLFDELLENEKLELLQEIFLKISNICFIEIGRYYNDRITHD